MPRSALRPGGLTLRWELGPTLPILVKGGAMGRVAGDPVYAAGMTYPWRESEMAWRWDGESGTWLPLPPLPLGRAYADGVTVDEGLLVVGGRRSSDGGRRSLADAWLLRRVEGPWERMPDLAHPRAVPILAACGHRVLAVGGGEWERSQGGAFATRHLRRAEILDLDRPGEGWRDLGDVPFAPRTGAYTASVGQEALIFGGYECWTDPERGRQIRVLADAWCFDFVAETWRALPDLPQAMCGGVAAAVENQVLLMGGVAYFERDGLRLPYGAGHTREPGTPRARWVGGYSDLVFAYDSGTGAYRLLEDRLPVGLNDVRCAVVAGHIYVAGGETVDAALSNTTDVFQIGTLVAAKPEPSAGPRPA